MLPHSKGLPSEVLLVTDDAVGQSDVMDSLNALTQQCLPEIMQPETMFRVLRVSQRNYTHGISPCTQNSSSISTRAFLLP